MFIPTIRIRFKAIRFNPYQWCKFLLVFNASILNAFLIENNFRTSLPFQSVLDHLKIKTRIFLEFSVFMNLFLEKHIHNMDPYYGSNYVILI